MDEPQRVGVRGHRGGDGRGAATEVADHFAAGDGEHHRRAEPRGVSQQLPPAHARRSTLGLGLGFRLGAHGVTTTVAVMNGWMVHRYSKRPGVVKV